MMKPEKEIDLYLADVAKRLIEAVNSIDTPEVPEDKGLQISFLVGGVCGLAWVLGEETEARKFLEALGVKFNEPPPDPS